MILYCVKKKGATCVFTMFVYRREKRLNGKYTRRAARISGWWN